VSDVRGETWLWLAQRISAAVLAVAVAVHLGGIIFAVQGGLTAAEIAGRVGGSLGWGAFYGVFVAAAAVHAPIGIRTVLGELTPLRASSVNVIAALFSLWLLLAGFAAVRAIYRLGAP